MKNYMNLLVLISIILLIISIIFFVVYKCHTDSYQDGVNTAQRVGKVLNKKGIVVLINFTTPLSSTARARRKGFLTTIKKEFPNIEIICHWCSRRCSCQHY